MSWEIKQTGDVTVVVLDAEMGIQNAADFHRAVLPLAVTDGTVQVDALSAKSIHTSIIQILYALSQAVTGFAVIAASEDFRAAEARMGIVFARSSEIETPVGRSGQT
jgi:anti-anti-sigma regulatory factor